MRWTLVGVLLGVPFGGELGVRWVNLWLSEVRRPEETVWVVVAARDIRAGEHVTEAEVYAFQIPPRWLPEGVFAAPEHVVGARATEDVLMNEFFRAERLEHGAANALVRMNRACLDGAADACAASVGLLPEVVGNGTAVELELAARWVARMAGTPDDVNRLKARLLEASAAANAANPSRCDGATRAGLPGEARMVWVGDEQTGHCQGARSLEVSEFTDLLAEVTTR